MSATERMTAYHIARLKDKIPEVRIKSIEELALLEATEALSLMEELYHSDPDEAVRAAAQKAGRTLYFKMKENAGNSPPGQ